MIPSLFISHGSPMTALMDTPARRFLKTLGGILPRPKAILVASAHWETSAPEVSAAPHASAMMDFQGFPKALYELRYNAPGVPVLADIVARQLHEAGFTAALDKTRGLDHGAWVPLLLAYPVADIPVLQLSIQPQLSPRHHLALGQALRHLREQDVLIIGSGSLTHNVRRLQYGLTLDTPEDADVTEFTAWMNEHLMRGDVPALLEYRTLAPYGKKQHPTEEHILPLYVALGAAGDTPKTEHLHGSVEYAAFRMDTYAFH